MNSGVIGMSLLGSGALVADPSLTTGGLVVAGLGFVIWFIKHQNSEIRRLTERLDEAKLRSDKRELQIAELKEELEALKQHHENSH